jgi:predicted transcriptional regulator
MPRQNHSGITMRERQILDILYRRGRITASEVMKELPGNPSYSTVRTQLRVLEEKGHAQHAEHRLRYVYEPTVPRNSVRQSAWLHGGYFLRRFGAQVIAALLGGPKVGSSRRTDRIAALIEEARKESADEPAITFTLRVTAILIAAFMALFWLENGPPHSGIGFLPRHCSLPPRFRR